MKKFRVYVTSVFLVAVCSTTAVASGWINGSEGLIHLKSAWVMQPRHLTLYAHSNFYGKVGKVTDLRSVAYWQVVGMANLSYGLSNHFEFGISTLVYQDNHKAGDENGYNLPDDLLASLKIGNYGSKTSSLTFGLSLNARFPTSEYHNLAFQEYSSGKFCWGFTGLMSYSMDPLYPEDDLALHLNLGYNNYNDVGEQPSEVGADPISVQSPTQEFLFGFGVKLPTREFDYGLEFFGNAYIQKPPVNTYAREDYFYITPSVVYRPQRWISFLFALDYRLTANKDETDYTYLSVGPYTSDEIPNYPTWRVNLGVKFVLLPTSVYQTSERDILLERAQSRRELFEQIIRERRQTESAEEELGRIKEERRKAERELERLRKILEDQAKRKEELEKLKEKIPDATKPPPPPTY